VNRILLVALYLIVQSLNKKLCYLVIIFVIISFNANRLKYDFICGVKDYRH